MFTTVERVKILTGYEVTLETISMAQGIIEAYVGRLEIEVEDPTDRMQMEKAVSYQAAYMRDNFQRVFEQAGVIQIAQSDGMVTLDSNRSAPFISPLAHIACRRLSWRGTRHVKTGPVFNENSRVHGWEYN
jgi:hypothetical protein